MEEVEEDRVAVSVGIVAGADGEIAEDEEDDDDAGVGLLDRPERRALKEDPSPEPAPKAGCDELLRGGRTELENPTPDEAPSVASVAGGRASGFRL